jgi:hypothetical protein
MAIAILSQSHRDLHQSELATLEALIDTAGIEAVIQGLSVICGLKADHITRAWQDTPLAKRWATLEGALGVASTRQQGCRPTPKRSEAAYAYGRMQPLTPTTGPEPNQ